MNRWKEDTRNPAECASENVGGNEDSAGSSFGSTQSKKTESEINLRTDLALKSHFEVENLTISTPKLSMSQKNDAEIAFDVRQDRDFRKRPDGDIGDSHFHDRRVPFGPQKGNEEEAGSQRLAFDGHHIRETILAQEAVFREQVRELHRVHGIQTHLMAQMRNRESDLHSSSSGTTIGGLGQPAFDYGVNLARWNGAVRPVLIHEGREAPTALVEPFKRGPAGAQREGYVSWNPQETVVAKKGLQMQPVRRTFDLERSPEADDEERQPDQQEERFRPEGSGMKFVESPVSGRSEPESDTSLNLSSGWAGARDAKDGNRQHLNVPDYDKFRLTKRPREEEAPLIPFLATRSENLRDTPTRPATAGGTQGFAGGLWGLQLERKLDGSFPADRSSPDQANLPKRERLSLNLEVEEKVAPASPSKCMPHWMLKVPAATTPKKDPCHSNVPTSNFRHSVSSPRKSSDQGPMRPFPPQGRGDYGSGPASQFWDKEKHISDSSPRSESQTSHSIQRLDEKDVPAGTKGLYGAPLVSGGLNGSMGVRYDSFKLSSTGAGGAPRAGVALYSKEIRELPRNGFSHSEIIPNHAVAGGCGVQMRKFEGSLGLSGRLPASPQVNVGIGPATFVPDAATGLWYRPRNLDPQFQRQHQHQHVLSLQPGVASARHGSWPISQNGGNGQGTVYAVPPTSAGQQVSFPVEGLRKVGDELLSGSNWTPTGSGPPFTPFSIVSPPKPPFKRPPKLVLTHDRNTMELKLVSTNGDGAKVSTLDRSFSGYSDEDPGDYRGTRVANGVLDHSKNTERDITFWARGRREEDKRGSMTSPLKDGSCPPSRRASDWMGAAKVVTSPHGGPQSGRNGYQSPPTNLPKAQQDGPMDDADGGSSDVGSGGSGVGDVINPGDRPSPPMGSFATRGCKRNVPPAGDGEECLNLGDVGAQADSESQSETVNNSHPLLEKADRRSQGRVRDRLPVTVGYGSDFSMGKRKANLGGSDHVVDKKSKHGSAGEELSEETGGVPQVLNLGMNSRTVKKSIHEDDGVAHGFRLSQESLNELRSTQLELQQPPSSTSQANMAHYISTESPGSGNPSKEVSNSVASSPSSSRQGSKGPKEQNGGINLEVPDDSGGPKTVGDQRDVSFSNFGDVRQQQRESKRAGHSKQLLGAAATSEKSDVQQMPYSPVLRRIPSPSSSTVDMDQHAEGRSKNLSQASETVQGNGRSPRRASERIGPQIVEQDDSCSPGGIDSSCEVQGDQEGEEMEGGGTPVTELQQNKPKPGQDVTSPGTSHSENLSKILLDQPDAGVVVTDSSCRMSFSAPAKASHYASPVGLGYGTVKQASKSKAEAWYRWTVPSFPRREEQGVLFMSP